jgi:nucleotide-binding universal stress UspA family protein
MKTIQSVLYATDFSHQAEAAFPLAVALARDYGATLTIAHVVPVPMVAYTMGELAALPDSNIEEARQLLEQIRPSDPNIHVDHRIAEGDPAREILDLAKKGHCDLIVMGTHGRSGLSRLMAGSVAEEVMRHAPCPVLTVRCPASTEYVAAEESNQQKGDKVLLEY